MEDALIGLRAHKLLAPLGLRPLVTRCIRKVRLTSSEGDGGRCRPHQNWLDSGPSPRDDAIVSSGHSIVNERMRETYPWVPTERGGGLGNRVYVPTRWAMLHPSWRDDPWSLLSGC
jgi:hypothetical protein